MMTLAFWAASTAAASFCRLPWSSPSERMMIAFLPVSLLSFSLAESLRGLGAWQPARLLASETRYAWRLWEHFWSPPEPGRYRLCCRAIDAAGNVQPDGQQADRESYAANWIVPVGVPLGSAAPPVLLPPQEQRKISTRASGSQSSCRRDHRLVFTSEGKTTHPIRANA